MTTYTSIMETIFLQPVTSPMQKSTIFTSMALLAVIFLTSACSASNGSSTPEPEVILTNYQTGLVSGQGNMYALLVGINEPNADFAPLERPAAEIDSLEIFLNSQNYRVTTLKNEQATKKAILDLIDQTMATAKTDDRVLFYFAGHAGTLDSLWQKLAPSLKDSILSLDAATSNAQFSDKEFFLIPRQKTNKRGATELVSFQEIVQHMDTPHRSIHQRVVIIDACFGGYFVNQSLLSSNIYGNVPADGFYALTSVKSTVADGAYFPFILQGLRGDADLYVEGNRNGRVGLYELSLFLDAMVALRHADKLGESFFSRYIMVGSGPMDLAISNAVVPN